MIVKLEKNELVIRLPLYPEPVLSKTEKTFVVAGSHGIVQTECQINGKTVSVGCNAFIKNDAFIKK